MTITGTTNTGLDRIISIIGDDYGLNARISGTQLRAGAAAADSMNGIIVSGIKALGLANDGEITTSDVYALNGFVRGRAIVQWTMLHGDDEDGVETGFHNVQNDGSISRLFGEDAVNTVFDGLYHLGFEVCNGRLLNEDGNQNAALSDVATWLNALLAPELAAGTLANTRVDPQFHGTTGTGLDSLVEIIVDDTGLNNRLSQIQINEGAAAADAMNRIIVDGIRATGIGDDGDLTERDMYDLNHWITTNRGAEWATLHGDDEQGLETGFHVVQNDGSRSYLFSEDAVDTIADGIYHLGFGTVWDRFLNEDGNANVRVTDVADWLTVLLREDLSNGSLDSGKAPVDSGTFAGDLVFSRVAPVNDDGSSGAIDLGKLPATRLANGTIAFDFHVDSPDDGQGHVLFSKDGASNAAGDITAYVHDGMLKFLIQDGARDYWISVEDVTIEAETAYSLALSFGEGGLQIYLDGEKVAAHYDLDVGLAGNTRNLVLDGGTWGRTDANPSVIWNHLDGAVSEFKIYDRALDVFEIAGLNNSGALPPDWAGVAVRGGAQPAVLKGTGLVGEVFDQGTSFGSIQDLIAKSVTGTPTHRFNANHIDFGGFDESPNLKAFLGDSATLTRGNGATAMTTIGLHMTGYVYIPEGKHLITVRSDDGFLLQLGGETLSSSPWNRGFEPTSESVTVTGGLYAINLYYFENSGREGLRFEIDGKAVGPEAFFARPEDYDAALAAHGAMPAGGLDSYDGPVGTTGTALDQLVSLIGHDEGLANNVSHKQLMTAGAAADAINHMIVDAIDDLGALDDGRLSVSDVYDISEWIQANRADAFVAAHGDDESGYETGFHFVQNDGGTTLLFGEDAVDTVLDGIYHIGFDTVWDRFVNEDGNANQRVETVTWWLNELLGTDPRPAAGSGIGTTFGSADAPDVTVSSGLNTVLANGAVNLMLKGTAVNGTGNGADNKLVGNGFANLLDGGDGNDLLLGYGGDDVLIGGRGLDVMKGGTGYDTYYVDDAGDQIVELAGQGRDTVNARISYVLGDTLEDLVLCGVGNINGTGNALCNRIEGNGGNNVLDGGAAADRLAGGLGNDTYIVDNKGDQVIELAEQGRDLVQSSVSFTLAEGLEDLTLTGSGDISGTGNAAANLLRGNVGNNLLVGGAGCDKLYGEDGNDRISGGAAADRLTGGAGADIFVFERLSDSGAASSARDAILDFAGVEGDRIDLRGIDAIGGGADDAFLFTNAFHGVAGELIATASATNWLVQADIDGDSTADFALLVTSAVSLGAADLYAVTGVAAVVAARRAVAIGTHDIFPSRLRSCRLHPFHPRRGSRRGWRYHFGGGDPGRCALHRRDGQP